MSASRKLQILVIENDPEWLGLVLRLFSDHVVKPVRDYTDALQIVQDENMVYDVAIVDLNLVDSIDPPVHRPPRHDRGQHDRDMLGGELLLKLHENHPSTLRVALTGAPPRGPLLRGLVDRFHVDEFVMKDDMDPADLRSRVLDSPAAKAAARERAVPGVATQKAEQRGRLHAWAEVRRAQLSQQMEDHQSDLRSIGRRTGDRSEAADEAELRSTIERLAKQRDALPGESAKIEEMLAGARSAADVARAAREIDRLMGSPDARGSG